MNLNIADAGTILSAFLQVVLSGKEREMLLSVSFKAKSVHEVMLEIVLVARMSRISFTYLY